MFFRATKNPFYLHVGRDILYNLNNHTKAVCGYATVHDVQVSLKAKLWLKAYCFLGQKSGGQTGKLLPIRDCQGSTKK